MRVKGTARSGTYGEVREGEGDEVRHIVVLCDPLWVVREEGREEGYEEGVRSQLSFCFHPGVACPECVHRSHGACCRTGGYTEEGDLETGELPLSRASHTLLSSWPLQRPRS